MIGKDNEKRRFATWGSKEWANEQLRFAISALMGNRGGSNWKSNLVLALSIKQRLLENGFPWQAARVENWVHRLQARRPDLEREREEASH